MMKKHFLLVLLSVVTGVAAVAKSPVDGANVASPARTSPNIILILSDDHGYGDLGCYGATDLSTPVLDRLAAEGVRFTDAHVTAPQCTPSRCGLITGVHQQRLGLEANPDDHYLHLFGFQDGKTSTMADLLKDAGYRTGMIGKWHIGETLDSQPFRNGFEWCRYMRGGMGYFWPANRGCQKDWNQENPPSGWWGDRFRDENDIVLPWEEGYVTDVFTDYAIDFVSAAQKDGRPFFLYLAYNAPHWPMEAPPELIDQFKHIEDPVRRIYAAMLKSMDSNIGRLVETLNDLKLRKNTLVVFLSDNGAPGSWSHGYNAGSNGPLNGFKGSLQEGGVRVPMIFNWPGHLAGGQTADWPVISLDLLPTFLALAGAETPAEKDGVNLLPTLLPTVTDAGPKHILRWRYLTQWATQTAIRDGEWKYYTHKGDAQLYRLSDDLGERNNLIKDYPEVADRLQKDLFSWMQTLPPRPKWIDKLYGE
ncbi:sulfatase-like hydrolase/transferase [Tichowtungia aerotolerans]|uniref:Sulfatase-like hydrolase/transferase n=1 Tax=Tichowtungia aerotolerans TaxID=2697043 RepID=A0A6P1M6Q6_9BACT|nr:sulfatase-like hydrolase/transferase [Tichowtungia aerotolerans]QHI68693.1 sulfatase-like hydrolase/transferase [Tichowtungia aerotolerans]